MKYVIGKKVELVAIPVVAKINVALFISVVLAAPAHLDFVMSNQETSPLPFDVLEVFAWTTNPGDNKPVFSKLRCKTVLSYAALFRRATHIMGLDSIIGSLE